MKKPAPVTDSELVTNPQRGDIVLLGATKRTVVYVDGYRKMVELEPDPRYGARSTWSDTWPTSCLRRVGA